MSRREPQVLRRWLVAVPLLAAAAAALGTVLAGRRLLAVAVATSAGGLVALGLAALARRRTASVADSIARLDEIASERARSQRLLDGLPTAILLFTATELAYANPAARTLFGVERSEQRSPRTVLGSEALADAVAEVRETGRSVELEVERSGRELVGRASVTSEGEVALVVTDLTEAKRIEAVRRDFVTNASHELKTPVAGIQALSDSLGLAVDRDPERARQMIQRLQQEAQRLGQLVRELLDLARLEESGSNARHRVDVAQLVRTQVARAARRAHARGISVEADCSEPAVVISLPQDLRLIVDNLIDNAIEYNRPGGAVTAAVRKAGSQVVFEVTDTGLGIPHAELDRIFERFYRVDKARSRQAGGTGLGLSIVRNAVQRHGGRVSVESVLGEGSTFRVVLPVEGERPAT